MIFRERLTLLALALMTTQKLSSGIWWPPCSMSVDSGAWLKAGMSMINKRFIMSSDEFAYVGETLLNVTLCLGSPLRWQVTLSKVSRVGVTEYSTY